MARKHRWSRLEGRTNPRFSALDMLFYNANLVIDSRHSHNDKDKGGFMIDQHFTVLPLLPSG